LHEEESIISHLVNPLLAKVLGYPANTHVLSDPVLMSILVVIISAIIFPLFKRRLKLWHPGRLQQIFEMAVEFLRNMVADYVGPQGKKYIPMIGTFGVFILIGSTLEFIPGLQPATGNYNTTLALAIFSFGYYNIIGIKELGLFKYLAHFGGSIWWMAPIMFPIEVVSHSARILSLSIRLFGNIFGDHMVVMVFTGFVPLIVPIPFIILAMIVILLQSFIFMTLSSIYLSGAVASEAH
jgi:F-type H+-transporting ATPase subunit a